jgi:hypothetical protein
MAGPHTKNGHLKDNRKNIRMETNVELTTIRKTKTGMAG